MSSQQRRSYEQGATSQITWPESLELFVQTMRERLKNAVPPERGRGSGFRSNGGVQEGSGWTNSVKQPVNYCDTEADNQIGR